MFLRFWCSPEIEYFSPVYPTHIQLCYTPVPYYVNVNFVTYDMRRQGAVQDKIPRSSSTCNASDLTVFDDPSNASHLLFFYYSSDNGNKTMRLNLISRNNNCDTIICRSDKVYVNDLFTIFKWSSYSATTVWSTQCYCCNCVFCHDY